MVVNIKRRRRFGVMTVPNQRTNEVVLMMMMTMTKKGKRMRMKVLTRMIQTMIQGQKKSVMIKWRT